jgi:hypothetical protein
VGVAPEAGAFQVIVIGAGPREVELLLAVATTLVGGLRWPAAEVPEPCPVEVK